MRSIIIKLALALLVGACGEDPGIAEVSGSATLPQCNDAPVRSIESTVWYDTGTVRVLTEGCEVAAGSVVDVCPLQWEMQQMGNDVEIVVDHEYRMRGRLCGDQLHLEGGWWLPLPDDSGQCGYADDDGTEVGIAEGGNTLTLGETELSGTLILEERCTAEYEVVLQLLYGQE